MISGGEFPLNLRKFEPFQATVPIDLDKSTRGPLPNASNQPIPEGKVEANDIGYIRFEDIPSLDPKFGKVRAVRVQANSEVPGLFGKEGGGWSPYSVVIEETGLAYAQVVRDGAKGVYGGVYNLNNPEFGGAAERALDIAVEIFSGHESGQLYQKGMNPLHKLARWILANSANSQRGLPIHLVEEADASLNGRPARALVDIDHDDPRYEPSVNIVQTHKDTKFASFDAVERVDSMVIDIFCIRFQSEVNVPEYGQTPPKEKKPEAPDPFATRNICFTRAGLQVYDPLQIAFVPASTSFERLALNAGVGLTALGNLESPMPMTEALKQATHNLKTAMGKEFPEIQELPKKDQIEFDKWDGIGAAAWGGS